MTYTQLKAKPGDYVWNEDQVQFVGRINKDGTEDKRFSQGGLCSLLNTILEQTGYVPSEPQAFARKIAEHRKSDYLVKGYGVVVKCYDLSAEMWAATAANYLGNEFNGIADILNCVSQSKDIEHKSKLETLALIFGKELKSKNLADYAGVTEFEKRLQDERKAKAKEETARKKSEKKLEQWLVKAFRYRTLLAKIVLHPWLIKGAYGDDTDWWLIKNHILTWMSKAMSYPIHERYHREIGDIFKKYNAQSISAVALRHAELNWDKQAYDALITLWDYHLDTSVSKERYEQAWKDIWIGYKKIN